MGPVLLPVSVYVMNWLIWEGRNLHANQISAKYLNPRLKTNVLHVGILFPVPTFTFVSPSACHSASAYQISSKSDHPRRSYDVIHFQDGGHGIATTSGFGFRDFAHLGRSKCTCIPNHTIRDIVMTSYPFSKMAAVSHIELSQGN